MDDQAVFQQEIHIAGYGKVIHRHFLWQFQHRYPHCRMAAAQFLAFLHIHRLHVFPGVIHNEMAFRTAESGAVLQRDLL